MKTKAFRRKCKGVISIFLTIIFLSCYILTGMLVDGGRYRMATAMAESALDSAADSILSNYNALVYDLYGLFATDLGGTDVESALTERFNRYVGDTLQIADIDYGNYQVLLGELLAGSIGGDDYFDGYDFEAEVNAGSCVTLANTANVEYQIVEHMKYRAPLQLIGQAGSFFNKLNDIVNIKNRIAAAGDRIAVVNSHEDLFKRSKKLITRINTFNDVVKIYAATGKFDASYAIKPPHNQAEEMKDKNTAWDIRDFIENERDEFIAATNTEKSDVNAKFEIVQITHLLDDDFDEESEYDNARVEVEDHNFEMIDNVLKARLKTYQEDLYDGANYIYYEAQEIKEEVEKINSEYNSYIEELERKQAGYSGDENAKTVFEPEIELAKANCGEILKNMDIILNARGYAQEILHFYSEPSIVDEIALENAVYMRKLQDTIVYASMDHPVGSVGDLHVNGRVKEYVDTVDEAMIKLMDISSYYYTARVQEVDVKNTDIDSSKKKEEVKDSTNAAGELRHLSENEENLDVEFEKPDNSKEVGTSLEYGDSADAGSIMSAGLSFINKLGELLEGTRDRLFVDEYILRTFPNYVYHYKMNDTDRENAVRQAEQGQPSHGKIYDQGPDYLIKNEEYWKYCASQAEVEYILTGETDAKEAAINVTARLLALRTVINGVAIFTDAAKINQANALAAIAGPFAPAVAIAILLGWAVAESALDVKHLMEGEQVLFWKQGGDWYLSVEGAINNIVDEVADELKEIAKKKSSQLINMVQNQANTIIYDVYNKGTEALGEIDSKLDGVLDTMQTSVSNISVEGYTAEDVKNITMGQVDLNSAIGQMRGEMDNAKDQALTDIQKKFLDDPKDHAIAYVSETCTKFETKAHEKIDSLVDKVSQQTIDALADKMPVGKVVNTGNSSDLSFRLGYSDYMRIFLLLMKNQTKIERIQRVIQANIRYGGESDFSMETAYSGIYADMTCTIKYLFMSDVIIPASMKRDGRMKFTVHTARAY